MLQLNAIAGFPSVHFDGQTTFLSIADGPSLQWGTSDYLVAVVARFSEGNSDQVLFQKSTMNSPYAGPQLFVNSDKPRLDTTAMAANSIQVSVVSEQNRLNEAPHIFAGRRFSTTLEVRVDGESPEKDRTTSVVDVSAPGMPAILGQNGYNPMPGFQALEGVIAEVVAVKGPIADADLRSLECHWILKYQL